MQGAPEQTSITSPPVRRNSDFWLRAATELRGSEWGSLPFLNRLLAVGTGEIRADGPVHVIEELL